MDLPRLNDLGNDLLSVKPYQRILAFVRPFLMIVLFFISWSLEWYILLPFIVAYLFVCMITVIHDVVHRNLGLSGPQTEFWLFLIGAIVLQSGHAFRTTHLTHHSHFPEGEDPEGFPAKLPVWKNLLLGIGYVPWLCFWAFQKLATRPGQRRWILLEMVTTLLFWIFALAIYPVTASVAVYGLMVWIGTWLYPVVTVYIQHNAHGENELTRSRTMRGKFIPKIFLGLPYHLEHHLYPRVPAPNMEKLAHSLDHYFEENGLKIPQVI